MEMTFRPVLENATKRPIIIAGPCSAESEEQVVNTAKALAAQGNVDLFRSGIWKPRTRPNSFEGVGVIGLKWLKRVKEEVGLKVTTEVAKRDHVFEALKYNIDVLWLGARTTVSPFAVQEIADALKGVDIPVIIKNPINPDLKLWIGAIERMYAAGIDRLAVIHRGFSYHGKTKYRNVPRWQLPIELKRQFPDLPIICDNSHICGRRDILKDVAQKSFDLNFDGLMTEVHPDPDNAWSDAAQQITPDVFEQLMGELVIRKKSTDDPEFLNQLDHLRQEIDELDEELITVLSKRMKIADEIGTYKKRNNIAILQAGRWSEILERSIAKGKERGLSEDFMNVIWMAIHQESINHQARIMNKEEKPEKSKA